MPQRHKVPAEISADSQYLYSVGVTLPLISRPSLLLLRRFPRALKKAFPKKGVEIRQVDTIFLATSQEVFPEALRSLPVAFHFE
jgi:hypothetical protein